MLCKQCGAELDSRAAFCANCGAPNADGGSGSVKNESQRPSGFSANPPYPASAVPAQQGYNCAPYPDPAMQGYQYGKSNNGHVSFFRAIKLLFTNYVNFTGRASRSEYWWAFLFLYFVNLMANIISLYIPFVGSLIILALLLPNLSLSIRRLHDTGKAWYYLLMGLIPLAGFIILIVLLCQASEGDNRWGPAFSAADMPCGQPYAPRQYAPQRQFTPQQPVPQNMPYQAAQPQITDKEIVEMAEQYEPVEFQSEDAKVLMDQVMMQLIPTFHGTGNLAMAVSGCNPQEIHDRIAAADVNALMAAFKTLGYRIGQGEDQNILGRVQHDVLCALKDRMRAKR